MIKLLKRSIKVSSLFSQYWKGIAFVTFLTITLLAQSSFIASPFKLMKPLCLPDDSLALIELYNATDGANWTNAWDLSQPWTTWDGVVLDATDSCVLELNLSGRGLIGQVPTSMFGGDNLNRIRVINLSNNQIDGDIPEEFGTLLTLTDLNLSENDFDGEIPATLANLTLLERLNLSFNSLEGTFPQALTDIATLLALEEINLDSNFLETVPIFNVNRPITINIANNRLKLNSIVENDKSQYDITYSPQDSIRDFKIINVPEGATLRDTVSANQVNGTTIYKWIRNGNPTPVREQNDDSVLVINNATVADHEGVYVVEVTHTGAPDITLSTKRFVVNVIECPSNNFIITTDTTACEGAPLPTIEATEAELGEAPFFSYKWEQALDGDTTNWTDASVGNVQNYALSTAGVTFTDTAYFRRILVPAPNVGCPGDTSDKVRVVILPNVTSNTLFPSVQNVCLGDFPIDIYGSTTDSSATSLFRYRYQVSLDSGTTWVDSLQTQNFAFTDSLVSADTIQFRRIVTGACAPDTSNVSTINVIPPVVADSIFSDQVICVGTRPDTLTGQTPVGGDPSDYRFFWQIATRLDSADWQTEDSLVSRFVPPVANDTFFVRRIVRSACFADTSNTVNIFVSPDLGNDTSAISIPRTQICVVDSIPNITGTAPVAPTGFRYQWEVSLDSSVWTSVDTLQNYDPQDSILFADVFMEVPDSFLVRRLVIDSCRSYSSNVLKLFMISPIDSASNLISYDGDGFCETDTLFDWVIDASTPTGGTGNYKYQWQISFDSTRWADRDDSLSITAFDLTESTYFRRLVLDSCVIDTSNVVFIPVFKSFGDNEISTPFTDICQFDSTTNITITGTDPQIIEDAGDYEFFYQQSRDTIAWFSSSTFTFSTGNFTDTQVFEPDTLFGGVNYFRRIVLGGCQPDTSNRIFVNVVPDILNNRISVDFEGETLCEGDTAWVMEATTPTGGTGNFDYQWQISFDSIAWANRDDSLLISNFALTEPTYFRRLVSDSCQVDTSNVVFVPVAKFFGLNQINTPLEEICLGDSTTISITGTDPENVDDIDDYEFFYQQSRDTISWFSSSTFTFSTGNFTETQTFVPDTLFGGTNYFRRIILGGCQPDTSNQLRVSIILNARNNFILGNGVEICRGDSMPTIFATQPIPGDSDTVQVIWQTSVDSINWVTQENDSINSFVPDSLIVRSFVRRGVKAGDCDFDFSNVVRVRIFQPIVNNFINTPTPIVCEGSASDTLRGTVPIGGDNTFAYTWQSRRSNDSLAVWRTVGSDETYFTGAINFDTEYRRIARTICFRDTSNTLTIAINPTIKNNEIDSGFVDCRLDTLSVIRGSVLLDTLGEIGQFRYQWQFSRDQSSWVDINDTNTPDYRPTPLDTTTFFRRLVINECFRDSSNIATITIRPTPNLTITRDTTIAIGTSIVLEATGAINYVWTPSETLENDSSATPTARPLVSTLYTVRGENINGCISTDSVFVTVTGTPRVRTVDAITPDGNGLNDEFYIEGIENYPGNTLIVINRWGQEVYRKEGYTNDWRGTYNGGILPAGTYFYVLKFDITPTIIRGSFEILR